MWNASLSPRCSFVQHAVGFDNLTLRIGEQRKCNLALLCEIRENFGRVITDRDDLDIRRVDSLDATLQFDQLPDAKWSPIRRSMEDQSDVAIFQEIINAYLLAVLVLQREAWCFRVDRRFLIAIAVL